jgi:hypothetical protein
MIKIYYTYQLIYIYDENEYKIRGISYECEIINALNLLRLFFLFCAYFLPLMDAVVVVVFAFFQSTNSGPVNWHHSAAFPNACHK